MISSDSSNPFTAKARKPAAKVAPLEQGESPRSFAGEMHPPVVITIQQKHKYQKKSVKPGNKNASPGCAVCNASRYHVDHIGAPPSLNALGDGDRHKYRDIKVAYEEALTMALEVSGLETGANRIDVQCRMGFPDRQGRDEGNFRFIPEKALGDVLQRMGFIPDDTFYPVLRYRFDNIEPVYDKGKSWVKYTIYAS